MPLVALLPFFSTLAGGLAAIRLLHRLHPIMAFASGVLVATAVADLLPEAHELAGPGAEVRLGVAALAGYLTFAFLEAFIHQSSFEHDAAPAASAGGRTAPVADGPIALLPPASLIAHSTLDGLAIGLGFQAGSSVGFIVLLAVLAHDFADGLNVVTLALDARRGMRPAILLLVLDAVAPIAGAMLSVLVTIDVATLGTLLAWFAGVFLAIGAGHLLPEAQHHDHREGPRLVGLAAVGAALVLAVRAVAA